MRTSFIFKNISLDRKFNFSNSLSSYGKKCIKFAEILVPNQSFEDNEESLFSINLPKINCFNPQTKSNLKKQLITYLVYDRNFKNKRFAQINNNNKIPDKKPFNNKDQLKEKVFINQSKSKIFEKISQTKPVITRNINESQSEKILFKSPKKVIKKNIFNSVSPSVYYYEQQTNFTKDYSTEIINSNIPSFNKNNNLNIFRNCFRTPIRLNKKNNKRRLNFSCDTKNEKSYLYNKLFNFGGNTIKINKNKSILDKILDNSKKRKKEKEKGKSNTISINSFENIN